jgi:O-antigen/teichoic acid export membrane protein
MQLVLPVILVRTVNPEAFGDYRLVWLIAVTALAVFPMAMPLSLFHFLPQAEARNRPALVGNTWFFVIVNGALAAGLMYATWAWMPESIGNLRRYSGMVPAFLALWVIASLIDVLPTADGNARWQAVAVVSLAILRTLALGLTAAVTGDVTLILLAMCAFALIKALLVPAYSLISASSPGLALNGALLAHQVRYAFPFAIGNAIFLLRAYSDQWIVAAYFPPEVFALISIAAIVLSASSLIRQPLNNATLPRLSSLIGQGDLPGARDLLTKTYMALGLVLLPALGLLFVTAHELVEIVYTPAYAGAAPLMQLYLIGQMTGVFAAGHLLVILKAGRLSSTISAVSFVVSVTCSLAGVYWFGLKGAVAGSLVSLVLGEVWSLIAVTRRLGTTVTNVISLRITTRVVAVVLISIALGWGLRAAALDTLTVWPRLIATACTYSIAVVAGARITRLHAVAFPLLRGLFSRSRSN